MKVQQDFIKRIFDSKCIPYEEVDIAAPHREEEKKYMQEQVGKTRRQIHETIEQTQQQQPEPILPPQLFHDNTYRGVSIMNTCWLRLADRHHLGSVGCSIHACAGVSDLAPVSCLISRTMSVPETSRNSK
jgi:glutaredoxin